MAPQQGNRLPPIWGVKNQGPTCVPVAALLLDGPFTDYHVSSLMLAAYMGHIEVRPPSVTNLSRPSSLSRLRLS